MNPTSPYTPKKNPVSEIGNHTAVENAQVLPKVVWMPHKFWAEAVDTAVYLENITPVASWNFVSPHKDGKDWALNMRIQESLVV